MWLLLQRGEAKGALGGLRLFRGQGSLFPSLLILAVTSDTSEVLLEAMTEEAKEWQCILRSVVRGPLGISSRMQAVCIPVHRLCPPLMPLGRFTF
jgi:hypothetical protein